MTAYFIPDFKYYMSIYLTNKTYIPNINVAKLEPLKPS